MHILISGAGIAGPVLAYWLTRHGYTVTVVERAPGLRKTAGHAVDLFGPGLQIVVGFGTVEILHQNACFATFGAIKQA